MSTLSTKGIQEYQKIFRKLYGVELTLKEAEEQATNLIDLLWSMLPKGSQSEDVYENLSTRATKQ